MSRVQAICNQLPKLDLLPSTPYEAFTLFPKLPIELRNKIWKFAAHEPRELSLTMRRTRTSAAWQPAILRTSRESRSEGSRYYSLCHRLPDHLIWINFDVDLFLLEPLLPRHSYPQPTIHGPTIFQYDTRILERIRTIVLYPCGRLEPDFYGDIGQRLDFLLGAKCQGSLPPALRALVRLDGYTMKQGPEDHFWAYLEVKKAFDSFRKRHGKRIFVHWD